MEDVERTPFGRRLFQAREAAKLSQKAVERAIGIKQNTLSEAEIKGKRSGKVPELAALYRVNPIWLATGKGPREIAPANTAAEATKTPYLVKPKGKREQRMDSIMAAAEKIDTEALLILLDKAQDLAEKYPAVVPKTAS